MLNKRDVYNFFMRYNFNFKKIIKHISNNRYYKDNIKYLYTIKNENVNGDALLFQWKVFTNILFNIFN